MTDPVDEPERETDETGPDDGPEPGSLLDAALGGFKTRRLGADTPSVSESGRPRLNWNPVTDAGGGGATDTQPRSPSSFQFDLGSALARLSDPVDEASLTSDESSHAAPAAEPPTTAPESVPSGASPDERRAVPDERSLESLPVRGGSAEAAAGSLPVRGGSGEAAAGSLPVRTPSSGEAAAGSLPVRGGSGEAAVESLPVRTPSSGDAAVEPLPTRTPRPDSGGDRSPATEPLPTRTSRPVGTMSAPADAPSADRPAARQPAKRSVFDDVSPAPTLPAAGAPNVPAPTVPTPSAAPIVPPAAATGLPTLPAQMPAAPPATVAPVESAPSTPELNALRSAQIRANRNDRRGKLFGRSVLAIVVLGALVGGALLFGRSYLFPTEWTAELTPIVDEVQRDRGVEFDETLALVERPAEEYGPLVAEHVLGADWSTRLPEWRALGLAGGDGAVADVQLRVASLYPAFYDPESANLIAAEGVSPETRRPALRLALETALTEQLGDDGAPAAGALGLTGLESVDAVARRAVDASETGIAGNAPDAVADLAGVPLPVAYQLRAFDELGVDLLTDVAPAGSGAPLPEAAARLDDGAVLAVGGLRQPGDQQLLEPVALGADDWALIWGARLPQMSAGRMADSLVADSYSAASRSGATCFLAVFEVDSEASGTALMVDLTAWVVNAPVGSQALATQLGPTRVQLEACDPGPDAAIAPGVGSVDLVLQRQLDRLSAG